MKIQKSILFICLVVLGQIGCASVMVTNWAPEESNFKAKPVRVFLGYATDEETFKSSGEIIVRDANDLTIKKAFDFLSLNPTALKAPISIHSSSQFLEYKGVSYRGSVLLKPIEGKIYIINLVPMEEYLLSVVPSEVSASWPKEALKAQAICARTYVVREMLNRKKQEFDVDTSTNTQVYKGKNKEHRNTTEAVFETEGLILIHKGQPIQSFFHSNAGGYTEDPANVWGNPVEYLKPVPSEYDKDGEQYSWEEKWKPDFVNTNLQYLGVGEIQDILVSSRFPSSRVNEMEIIGTSGSKKIKATEFRKKLGATKLKSTRFGIRKEESGDYFVKGLGSGHGVGMSQWGSFAMAKSHFNHREILQHYFKGIEFARIVAR
ncbi:SpoIID/LytB domain-containing protein [Leptospira sp. 85282-16]|uniref:SpoIID/LytB domain-containing protein n=1 Tax=Leptospira montravelensis TaxID=2484961 RepID=A0ABY2LUG2_9LEPT|nr:MULTISPECIES: SpoIID/LytB domain-containing protein [Leptospira]MCT8334921.1 SpoIID/LytB domain-containing protein [Leptospira sp. 85282-16]TGK78817.1 SpoIID/LytB domain-containing protein [Leptospira montravelensis]TGL02518.1 SpoIID/LytB domain-containing protein [Leptospira montravelensis]